MSQPTPALKVPKSVRIEEAENGYTVSTSDSDKNKTFVCKTLDEAMSAVRGMMADTTDAAVRQSAATSFFKKADQPAAAGQ